MRAGGALVVVVDDEPAVLAALRRTLRNLPIRLLCLGSAEEALEVVRMQSPAALVSDHGLPGISGLELLIELRSRWPQIRTLLHTGDPIARERAAQLRLSAVEKGAAPGTLRAMVWALVGEVSASG